MHIPPSLPPFSPARPASSGGIVDEVRRLANIFAEGSGATKEEKLAAYVDCWNLQSGKPWEDPSSYARQSTQAERDEINAVWAGSSFVQDLHAAADRFSAKLNAGARTDGPYGWLEAFNALSDWDQQRVRVGMGWHQKSASVEDLKAELKASGDRQVAAEAADAAKKPKAKDEVKLSEEAEEALTSLKEGKADPIAAAILASLEKATAERQEAMEDQRERERPGLYAPGDNLAVDV